MACNKKIIVFAIVVIAVAIISIIALDISEKRFVFFDSFLIAVKKIETSNYVILHIVTMVLVICVYSTIPLLILLVLILKKNINGKVEKKHIPLLIIDLALSLLVISAVCFGIFHALASIL